MRAHYVIAVVAVLVIGLGAKQYFSPPIKALADIHAIHSHRSASMLSASRTSIQQHAVGSCCRSSFA